MTKEQLDNSTNEDESLRDIEQDFDDIEKQDTETVKEDETEKKLIDDLQKQILDMKDLAQRTQAEFMNYKKRVAKEKQDILVFANEQIITQMLSILDNFQRAIESEKENQSNFYKGVQLIEKELEKVLFQNGLKEIESLDQEFNPNFHHAVMQVSVEGKEPDKVVEILQKGYILKDKVIRPAMVKVSK